MPPTGWADGAAFFRTDGERAWHAGRQDGREFVLANRALPHSAPTTTPYFEVEIQAVLPTTHDFLPTAVIGLRRKGATATRGHLPGWTRDTVGYHGDDGNGFLRSKSAMLGPTFGEGDVVGCGVLPSGEVFFTLNGDALGVPFPGESFAGARPCVGSDCPMAFVGNFGARPFVADLPRVLLQVRDRYARAARSLAAGRSPLERLAWAPAAVTQQLMALACDGPRAVLRVGLLCRQWRRRSLDDEGLWRFLARRRWPLLPVARMPRVRSWRRLVRRRAELERGSPGGHVIDGCRHQARLGALADGLPGYTCPVVADGLTRAGDDPTALFCGVCKSHVIPVTCAEEAEEAVAEGCVVTYGDPPGLAGSGGAVL